VASHWFGATQNEKTIHTHQTLTAKNSKASEELSEALLFCCDLENEYSRLPHAVVIGILLQAFVQCLAERVGLALSGFAPHYAPL
jgi:hypothetical protein